ncbi:AMP-binding protein [Saccharopolyspora sp. NFXS83]|uniref:class I adenylate-forming enzyme family protein n=1 Tax=Saccharopolyspora sp. NFXS83 TaxID=2993560 RepID=UPI00224B7F2E|nr:AMP-binding protein [Saccharopolyspora sp. NFXS83]MCX2728866.1 AMP-binding protein [Saccharopolyspora sp. NFXS83]
MSTDACPPQVTGESGAANSDVNLADLVRAAAERGPDHPALIDIAGHEMNWSELDAAVTGFGRRLLDEGVRPGDRVALALSTGFEFCIALFAVFRIGATAVPLPPTAPGPELRRVLDDSGARLLITVRGDDSEPDEDFGVPRLDPPTGSERADLPLPQAPADLAVLCYTSGTSGPARGAMLPHSALLANVRQCARLRPMPVNAADRVLLALPMYHAFGLGPGMLQVAAVGATAVLLPHFDAEESLATIARHRVTCVVGVPPMYRAWLRTLPDRLREGMSTVRLLTSGAAPLGADVAAAVRSATGLDVFEGYGLTETGPVVTTTLASERAKPGSVGRALPGVQLRLVDADGSPMDEADGDTGRVAVRGANLFRGYWPDAAHGPDDEGWFRTGDVGYFDGDGDLHLVDRATDLIIVNGFNVYPREVEVALAELAGVRESAVVGVPDEEQGEAIKAVVVTEPGAELTPEEVRAHCAARLAKFKVPGEVVFASTLPHSPTGKIARRTLRSPTP